jgi:hypothetical protein
LWYLTLTLSKQFQIWIVRQPVGIRGSEEHVGKPSHNRNLWGLPSPVAAAHVAPLPHPPQHACLYLGNLIFRLLSSTISGLVLRQTPDYLPRTWAIHNARTQWLTHIAALPFPPPPYHRTGRVTTQEVWWCEPYTANCHHLRSPPSESWRAAGESQQESSRLPWNPIWQPYLTVMWFRN